VVRRLYSEQTYTLSVNKPVPFDQIVQTRWNNTLTVIPASVDGYTFSSYQWYRNDRPILNATARSWSAGADGTRLSASDAYHIEIITSQGTSLRSCPNNISLSNFSVNAYPNPVRTGQTLYIEANVDDELLHGAVIEVYNITGHRVAYLQVQGRTTPVSVEYVAGSYIFVLKGSDGFRKELKVMVD